MKTPNHLKIMLQYVKDILLFKENDTPFSIICWVVLPLLPVCILGWYIADTLYNKE